MTVIGLVGSPRKGGNTDLLVEEVLKGAGNNGHGTSKVYLHGRKIGPCVDCRGCKKEPHRCIVEDEMQEVYKVLDDSDVVVFGTPVYWYGPTAQMKVVVDRLRPYFTNHRMDGKRAVIVAPAGDGPGDADLLVEFFRRVCTTLHMEFAGVVLGTAYDRGEILVDFEAMEAATTVGASL